jgi:hypothetical protein
VLSSAIAASARRPTAPPPEQSEAHLRELIHPLTLGQVAHYHDLGLRQCVLSLPVLVALVLSMIWRQVGSVRTLVQVLRHEGLLWTSPVQVSPQALALRLSTVPAGLFHRVVRDLLPQMQARWAERTRPLPPEGAWARDHFTAVLAVDGSTLDALLRKVGLLRDRADVPLAGRMLALHGARGRAPPPVIVIGMHRSSTTMLAGMLTELGLFFGLRHFAVRVAPRLHALGYATMVPSNSGRRPVRVPARGDTQVAIGR